MICTLHVGMHVRLPSGAVVVLLRRERTQWVCEFADMPRQRGEIEFTGVWLRRFGFTVC